jgi:hypothetical protein
MSSTSNKQVNLLILSLNSLWHPCILWGDDLALSTRFMFWLIRILQSLGYVPTTIQQALKSGQKKNIVLTYEIHDQSNLIPPPLLALDCPMTLFIRTSSMTPLDKTSDHPEIHFKEQTSSLADLHIGIQEKKWEIGLAGHDLLDLTTMNRSLQMNYLKDSLNIFYDNLGFEPKSFLYPLGAYDASTVSILRQLNFTAGITSIEGINFLSPLVHENFHLRRIISDKDNLKMYWKTLKYLSSGVYVQNSSESPIGDLIKFPTL